MAGAPFLPYKYKRFKDLVWQFAKMKTSLQLLSWQSGTDYFSGTRYGGKGNWRVSRAILLCL